MNAATYPAELQLASSDLEQGRLYRPTEKNRLLNRWTRRSWSEPQQRTFGFRTGTHSVHDREK
jgi:hypothetical protein